MVKDALEVRAVPVAHLLNALSLLGTFVVAIRGHRLQPERIPLHFDLAGNPDRWGPKTWGNTLAVPLVALCLTALVYATARATGWLRRRPGLLSVPEKEAFLALPPERQDPVWRLLAASLHWLAVPTSLVFLTMSSLRPGDDGRLHVWPVFVPAALLFALLPVVTVRLSREVRRAVAAEPRRTAR